MLLLGDQPGVTPAVAALLAGRGDAPLAVVPLRRRPRPSVRLRPRGVPRPAGLHGDKGVWRLLDRAAADVAEVPVAGAVPLDVDTPEDYEAVLAAPHERRHERASGAEIAELVPDVETLAARSTAVDYLADEGLATAMFLTLRLPQPLLLEGEAGVGKTEAARALAAALDTPLIRLQCYEGIDSAEALYEWNYPRQLLRIRLAEAAGDGRSARRTCSAPST